MSVRNRSRELIGFYISMPQRNALISYYSFLRNVHDFIISPSKFFVFKTENPSNRTLNQSKKTLHH